MPIKLFQNGQVLDAADVNTFFMDQSLVVFDDEASRDNAFGAPGNVDGKPVLKEGRICYLKDDQTIYIYVSEVPGTGLPGWTAQLANIEDNTITSQKLTSSLSFTTPTLGVASATSINRVVLTAPATNATITLANGSTLVTSGAHSVTLTSTATTSVILPTNGTLATIAGSETLTSKTLTGPIVNGSGVVFEGATADDFETTLTVVDPTSDRTITLPNVSGTVVTTGDAETVGETMINYTTVPKQTVSTSNPSGGKQHDIWIKVA